MRLVNVMETLVTGIIDEMVREGKMCACARCRIDVAAIALNNLPPLYVATLEGETIKSSMTEYREYAMRIVPRAIEVVKKKPHHRHIGE